MNNQSDKLVKAYKRMMEAVDGEDLTTIDVAIDAAERAMVKRDELTSEEAAKVAYYLRHDLHNMAEFIDEEERPVEDWFTFDWRLAENKTWETFMSVADRARVELATFNQRLENPGDYHTGEITGIGTLQCVACGYRQHFYDAQVICACAECHENHFIRVKD